MQRLRDHLQPNRHCGSRREALIRTVDCIGTHKKFKRCQEICNGEDGAGSWYRMISGAVRRYTILPDGRRQITALLLPGDFFGSLGGHGQGWILESISDGTKIVECPARNIGALAANDLDMACELLEVVYQDVCRLEEQVLNIGRAKATEKVALFILHIAEHPSLSSAPLITLPLSRYDIADYLAISSETVCRCFTDLKNEGVIKLFGPRHLTITDRDALASLACADPFE